MHFSAQTQLPAATLAQSDDRLASLLEHMEFVASLEQDSDFGVGTGPGTGNPEG